MRGPQRATKRTGDDDPMKKLSTAIEHARSSFTHIHRAIDSVVRAKREFSLDEVREVIARELPEQRRYQVDDLLAAVLTKDASGRWQWRK